MHISIERQIVTEFQISEEISQKNEIVHSIQKCSFVIEVKSNWKSHNSRFSHNNLIIIYFSGILREISKKIFMYFLQNENNLKYCLLNSLVLLIICTLILVIKFNGFASILLISICLKFIIGYLNKTKSLKSCDKFS